MTELAPISPEIVEETWAEVAQWTQDEACAETERLAEAQAPLFHFLLETTAELGADSQSFVFFLAAVIHRTFQKAYPLDLPRVRPKDIRRIYEANAHWLDEACEAGEGALARGDLPDFQIEQPWLLQVLVGCLFASEEAEEIAGDDERGELFLVMKTFVDALDEAAKGRADRGATGRRERPRAAAPVYRLKVTLKGIRPPIWRRLLVPADVPLDTLHLILQIAMGWTDSHLHLFRVGQRQIGVPDPERGEVVDERRVRLADVAPGEKARFVYDYDFGDGWEHLVQVEEVLPPGPGVELPVCLKGRRACPPEDCGGAWGYQDILDTLSDPEDPGYAEALEWVGEDWDAERFDPDEVNEMLRDFICLDG
ncbi:MAG: hypothetical protein Kow0092_35860 [Deferrisomatales bacterium]